MLKVLRERFEPGGDKVTELRTELVGPQVGSELKTAAVLALFFALVAQLIYVTVRFELRYAVGAILALFHDAWMGITALAVFYMDIDMSVIAALLTIVGYSITDTIVVFDRVRENTPLLRKNSFPQIVNVSIWETLTRSLNTSLITLFPIATLLVFGGATLQDFAFALLIGIASGAYSSIFIAAPLLSMWKGHEAEFRRRQATGIEKATLGTVAPALAGGSTATATVPVTKKADGLSETVPVPELSDEERAAREAAKRRRDERRRKQGRGHGRRT
jgi:preprotein translocase SecF subunit